MAILDLFSLDGRVACVTGGGGGIGRGIALGLAEAGADVALVGRRAHKLEEVAKEIEARGRRSLCVPMDVRETAAVEALVDQLVEHFGQLDIFVSNAGGLQEQGLNRLHDTPESSWDATVALNFKAPWACAKAAWRVMHERGGVILNVSSVGGLARGAPHNGVYTAAKAGLNHLTATLALEMAPRVRVNALAPGPVRTEDYEDASGFTDRQFEKLGTKVPLGRLGIDEDFGAAAVYLASDASRWVTGHVLAVSGGP